MNGVLVGGVINVIGVLIGGLITWLVSKSYYEKAGAQLKNESELVRKKVDMVLHGMEAARLITVQHDTNGEVVGYGVERGLLGVQAKADV